MTWTSWNGYDGKEGQTLPLGRETWITTAPELQRFCQGLTHGAALDRASVLRLEQLLGLPAGGGKDRFVELWVDPADANPSSEVGLSASAGSGSVRWFKR